MNNGKYHTVDYKRKQEEKNNRLYGPILEHQKTCNRCNKKFIFKGRLQTKKYQNAIFCSRSCANNRQQWWNSNSTHYRTLALRHHDKKCFVCGFDKIIAIHHIDENKLNNSLENLIPLCPNHHEMVHSKWKYEVIPYIEEWKRGISANGNTVALQASIKGSIPLSSTKLIGE